MGRDDDFWDDDYWRYVNSGGDSGGGYSGGGSGGIFKFVVIAIVVLIILALVLGVGIPGAVWSLFIKVIAIVGFFTFLGSLGGKKSYFDKVCQFC